MSTCTNILPRLTAYLDGELPGDDGSVVRGHLRECAACRQVARDEAALRDGLRQLVPVDPPASLWAGVQAQLAAAEVADAHTPWWRRAARRWTPAMPSIRQVAAGSLLAAAAVVALSLHARQRDEAPVQIATAPVPPAPAAAPTAKVSVPAADDVTADLLAEPARTTARYDQVIEELMKLASEARPTWSDERRAAFDTRVAELKTNLDQSAGAEPRHQQRIQRTWIRYLQDAVVRDDVMLASGGAR
ncbi:MAG: anti-sigma factor [Kofleriaceae bacterium]